MKTIFLILVSICMLSCATSKRLNKISIGMSKDETIQLLGTPSSISSPGPDQEFLNYRFSETDDDAMEGRTVPYYVLIEHGRVKQYGRHGDFGLNQDPTVVINTTSGEKTDNEKNETSTELMQKELNALKELYDDGILTKEEFEKKKKEILNRY